jgi:uncharacterized protein
MSASVECGKGKNLTFYANVYTIIWRGFPMFDWDNGNWPKCAKHGLTKTEIEFVLSSTPFVLPDKNTNLEEAWFNAVGQTHKGRHLFIVFTFRTLTGLQLMRPISARYMHAKEIERYEQR